MRLGRRALELDPTARRVRLDDGQVLDYDALLLATGALCGLAGAWRITRQPN